MSEELKVMREGIEAGTKWQAKDDPRARLVIEATEGDTVWYRFERTKACFEQSRAKFLAAFAPCASGGLK